MVTQRTDRRKTCASSRVPGPLGSSRAWLLQTCRGQFLQPKKRASDEKFKLKLKHSLPKPMCIVRCVARADVTTYEQAEKGDPELIPFSLQQAETHCSESSTNPATIVASNGSSSPISSLMEELLVMIFDDVITSESSSCQCRRKRAGWWLSSPRNLANVSRAWRAIVFACPMLWRYVHLTPVQSIHALKEHLWLSSPLPIHLTVHQWPFRNPIPASAPFSIVALTAQLRSILSPMDREGTTLAPVSERVESLTINATESSTFLNFVLQTWTGRASKFPALRHMAMNGNLCATWSRACFFDGRNVPRLERLELSNVVIAHSVRRLPWGMGLNLTTLVWTAPVHEHGSLVVSVSCFHHVVSSFPNLTALELHEHVVAFESATLESLADSGVTPLTHLRDLRVTGRVFLHAVSAYMLFYLLPSLRHVAVRGRACSGPTGLPTVTLALQALMCLPRLFSWPTVLPSLEDLELDCVEGSVCTEWKTWCVGEYELWKQWQEGTARRGGQSNVARVRMHMDADEVRIGAEAEESDHETR